MTTRQPSDEQFRKAVSDRQTYAVTLSATRYVSAVVEVEATDRKQAEALALELANDLDDWNDNNGVEDISVIQVSEADDPDDNE